VREEILLLYSMIVPENGGFVNGFEKGNA